MESLRYRTIIKNDGEIRLTGVPLKKGQEVEMFILVETNDADNKAASDFHAISLKTSGFKFNREAAHER